MRKALYSLPALSEAMAAVNKRYLAHISQWPDWTRERHDLWAITASVRDENDITLETGMAGSGSGAVIGSTRLPASRTVSPFRYSRFEPESLVKPSTAPSPLPSSSVSRLKSGVPLFMSPEGAGHTSEEPTEGRQLAVGCP